MRLGLALAALIVTQVAQADPYNSYQFNRRNWEAQNGRTDCSPWYEWWYYKAIADDGSPFFFIYGVVNPWDTTQSQKASAAIVSIGNFRTHEQLEQRLPVADFSASYVQTEVHVGATSAFDDQVQGEVPAAHWSLHFDREWGWNAMGWGLPFNRFSNISWYPAQAAARATGFVDFMGRHYTFTQSAAYQDRNWGSSFPRWWYWLASNSFAGHPEAALACGGGMPLVAGREVLPIFTCGLKYKDQEFSFRNADANRYAYVIRYGHWELELENLQYRLVVTASAPEQKFMDLHFVAPDAHIFHDMEALDGHLEAKLYKNNFGQWQWLDTLLSEQAGIEFGAAELPVFEP